MSPLLDTPPPRVRRTREELRAVTRSRLLNAAWELYREKGYHDLTAEEITARAGYSTTPLYNMFGSKERLFIELYIELTKVTEQRGRDFGPLGISMREAMLAYGHMVTGALKEEEYLAQIGLGAVISSFTLTTVEEGEWGQSMVRRHRTSMAAALTRYAEAAGETLPLPAERLAHMLLSMTSGLLLQALDPDERSMHALWDVIDLLFPG